MNKSDNFALSIINIIFPWGIIVLLALTFWYYSTHPEASEPYDPEYDPRIENCGPGGTYC